MSHSIGLIRPGVGATRCVGADPGRHGSFRRWRDRSHWAATGPAAGWGRARGLRADTDRITVIDLNEGNIRWVVPPGNGPRDHPLLKPLNQPPLGNPGRGGLFATKTLLFVGEGDPVVVRAGSRLPPGMPLSIAPGAGGRMFRALDKRTGAVVWETELPAGTTGAPITYMARGKQFIVVAIGRIDHPPEFVALSLP